MAPKKKPRGRRRNRSVQGYCYMLGLHWDNGKRNGNYHIIRLGIYRGYIEPETHNIFVSYCIPPGKLFRVLGGKHILAVA